MPFSPSAFSTCMRARSRLPVWCLAAAALTACAPQQGALVEAGSSVVDSGSAQSEAVPNSWLGEYVLDSVRGKPLPYSITVTGTPVLPTTVPPTTAPPTGSSQLRRLVTYLEQRIVLARDGSYTASESYRYTDGEVSTVRTSTQSGRYSRVLSQQRLRLTRANGASNGFDVIGNGLALNGCGLPNNLPGTAHCDPHHYTRSATSPGR